MLNQIHSWKTVSAARLKITGCRLSHSLPPIATIGCNGPTLITGTTWGIKNKDKHFKGSRYKDRKLQDNMKQGAEVVLILTESGKSPNAQII